MHPTVNMLWIGDRLGWVEQLSIVSFLAAGHPVHLHTYSELAGVPDGTTVVDGNLTVPEQTMTALMQGKRGHRSLTSNYFRMILQENGAGMWMDADMICLKPIPIDPAAPMFGWQDPKTINGAALYLPKGSPVTREILMAFKPNHIPAWLNFTRKRQLWMKRLAFIQFGAADQARTTFGPKALTYAVTKHGQAPLAAEAEVFYPYPHARARAVFEPGTRMEQFIGPKTLTVHLWNELLAEHRDKPPARDTAVGEMMARFGL